MVMRESAYCAHNVTFLKIFFEADHVSYVIPAWVTVLKNVGKRLNSQTRRCFVKLYLSLIVQF